MEYRHKIRVVQAIRLTNSIMDESGKKLAGSGDWLVIDGDEQKYLSNSEFQEQFELNIPIPQVNISGTQMEPVYVPSVFPQIPSNPQITWGRS